MVRSYAGSRQGGFSGKVFCGRCGAPVHKVTDHWTKGGEPITITYWRCSTARSECDLPRLMEEDLLQACKDVLGDELESELLFARDAVKLTVFEDRLEFELKDGEVSTWQKR